MYELSGNALAEVPATTFAGGGVLDKRMAPGAVLFLPYAAAFENFDRAVDFIGVC